MRHLRCRELLGSVLLLWNVKFYLWGDEVYLPFSIYELKNGYLRTVKKNSKDNKEGTKMKKRWIVILGIILLVVLGGFLTYSKMFVSVKNTWGFGIPKVREKQ